MQSLVSNLGSFDIHIAFEKEGRRKVDELSGKIECFFGFIPFFRQKELDKQPRHGVALGQAFDAVLRCTLDKANAGKRCFGIDLIVFLAAPRRAVDPKFSVQQAQ